jgi:hypothetical protein
MSAPRKRAELAKIEPAVAAQERLRGILADAQVEAALRPLLEKLQPLARPPWLGDRGHHPASSIGARRERTLPDAIVPGAAPPAQQRQHLKF